EDGAVGKQGVVLEDHTHVAAMGRHLVHPLTLDEDVARGRVHEARYRTEARGLPTAGGPEEREELACLHGERDAVEGQRLAVALDETTELDVGRGGKRAQRSSLFQRSVHWGRCRATLAQSKSTSLSTSAGP